MSDGPKILKAEQVPFLVLLFFGCYGLVFLDPRCWETTGLSAALLGGGLFLAGWVGSAAYISRKKRGPLGVELQFKRSHLVPIIAQGVIYLYWGLYWEPLFDQLPLIFVQIAFAFLFDLGLSWRRYGNFRLSFGPIPIVLSTNLFLWFRDPVFVWQLVLIAIIYLSRAYITREVNGKRSHIFNPSAFALAIVAAVLVSGRWVHHTWANAIPLGLAEGPLAYEVMFGAGIISQFFVGITLMPLASTVVLIGLGFLYHQITGVWFYVDTAIPVAMLIAISLLVTDPATSPRTHVGKILFGAFYAVGSMAFYLLFRMIEAPPAGDDPGLAAAFFDKLMFVPFLNLAVPWLDRLGTGNRLNGMMGAGSGLKERLVHIALWALVFVGIRAQLVAHPGGGSLFWREACEQGRYRACKDLVRVVASPCADGDPAACHNLAVLFDEGKILEKDTAEAKRLWTLSCQNGVPESCVALGTLYMDPETQPHDPKLAMTIFDTGCQQPKGATACSMAAFAALEAASLQVPVDAIKNYLQKGCDGGHAMGCDVLAREWVSGRFGPPDGRAVVQLLNRACDGGFAPGCNHLGDALRYGAAGVPNGEQLRQAYRKGCEGGVAEACVSLAQLNERGELVPIDSERARAAYRRACDLGVREACPR